MKERAHDKAFYQLCLHMEADYHQLEFDLRVYLTHLDAGGEPLWATTSSESSLPDASDEKIHRQPGKLG
jgi:hypothetical protein